MNLGFMENQGVVLKIIWFLSLMIEAFGLGTFKINMDLDEKYLSMTVAKLSWTLVCDGPGMMNQSSLFRNILN
jgi:hypothetical protein